MTAMLRQTSSFLERLGKRFHEARQAKAQRIIDEHLRYYQKGHALGTQQSFPAAVGKLAPMPDRVFRYVRYERTAAWEAAGWTVISGPLELKPPPELEGSARAVPVMIVGWARAGRPVETIY